MSILTENTPAAIIYNAQQQAAIADMERYVESGLRDPYVLQGYAGTGKTTLVRELLSRLKIPMSRVALVAPTNRAAKVLANKTGLHTMTIHRLIYLTVREELDFQRERLHIWQEAANFTELADLVIESNEVDLQELYREENPTAERKYLDDLRDWEEDFEVFVAEKTALGEEAFEEHFRDAPDIADYTDSGTDADWTAFLDKHRVLVLKHEGIILPDDPAQRLAYFDKIRAERVGEHREAIRQLLSEELKVRKKEPKEIIERYSLFIVDEASMVNQVIGRDLISYGIPTILVGDPFQLPPVKAKAFWHGMKAHSILTKIERQKGPGAGIPLAGERIRQGKDLVRNESLEIHRQGTLPNERFLECDQIIVGMHRTRERVCRVVRRLMQYGTPHPQVGEKIVAVYNDKVLGIMNGELYRVLKVEVIKGGKVVKMDLQDPYNKTIVGATAWVEGFEGRTKTDFLPDHYGKFWWGYAITCHQSQGSEWKNIIVCDEWPGDSHDRWLYTAITRASMKCDLIR